MTALAILFFVSLVLIGIAMLFLNTNEAGILGALPMFAGLAGIAVSALWAFILFVTRTP